MNEKKPAIVTVAAIQIEFEQPIEIDLARLRGIMQNFGQRIGRNIEQQTRYNWNYFAEIPGQEQPADPKGSLKVVPVENKPLIIMPDDGIITG